MKSPGIFLFVISIVLMFCITKTHANFWNAPDIPENLTDTEVLETWKKLDKNLKGAVHSIIKTLMPKLLQSSEKIKLSPECIKESMHLISGLRSLKQWAFSFIDSSAKMVDGVLTGSVSFLGVYDECLNITVPHGKNKTAVLYRGKYCTIEARAPLPRQKRRYKLYDQLEALANFSGTEVVKFLAKNAHLNYFLRYHIGVCVPSGCTEDDLSQLLQLASEKLLLPLEVTHCEIKENKVQLSNIQIFTIVLWCFLGALVLSATWFDIRNKEGNTYYDTTSKVFWNGTSRMGHLTRISFDWHALCLIGILVGISTQYQCSGTGAPTYINSYKRICCRILLCFSLKYNFKRLVSTHTSSDSLKCIHGFRFLSITWVVLCHCYLYTGWFSRSFSSMFLSESIVTAPESQMILNGSEAVDSFFFMAGMLVCYVTLKFVKLEKKRFNLKAFLIHRLWRIIPVYYFILLFVTLAPLMGSGPLFHETLTESMEPCSKYWWRNALFINNFFHMKDICMMHTWFISCEMQLFLASLLVLLPMLKSEKIGVAINILIIVVSVVYTGIISYVKELLPTVIMTYPDPTDRNLGMLYTYGNPLSRAGPYFIGVFTGYLILKFPDIKIPRKLLIFGWCMAVVCSGTTIFITGAWFKVRDPTQLEVLMYGTFYKVAYTAGIAWMIFCCVTGHGGFINVFLSWKAWVPLSKLAFLIYLIEPIYQTLYIANFRIPQEFTHMHCITQFFGFLCISSLLAMIVNLLVESPTWRLEKIFFETRAVKIEKSGMENGIINDTSTITMNGKKDSGLENGFENMSFDSKI